MKYPSLLFILGLISLCFREIINMNSSIQNQFVFNSFNFKTFKFLFFKSINLNNFIENMQKT